MARPDHDYRNSENLLSGIAEPRTVRFTDEQAQAHWNELDRRGMTIDYKGRPLQYGHPVELSPQYAGVLRQAAEASWDVIDNSIQTAGGLTAWLGSRDRAPKLGNERLNFPDVNAQFEARMRAGEVPPLVFDTMWARDMRTGQRMPKVPEVQTGIGYFGMYREMIAAGGIDPDSKQAWEGKTDPTAIMLAMRERVAQGRSITVMDTNPYGLADSHIDQTRMAQMLGNSNPISPLDLREDEEGYYYYEAVTNADGRVVIDERGKTIRPERDDNKRRVTDVLSRMTQDDLTSLDQRLGDNDEQRRLVMKFLSDPQVNHVWHPAWQYIATKHDLGIIRAGLLEKKSPLSELFVPEYTTGEVVQPGTYFRKPTDAVQGRGAHLVDVTEAGQVEERWMYQEPIVVQPVAVRVADRLAGRFAPHVQSDIVAPYVLPDTNHTPGTYDVRYMPVLGSTRETGLSGPFQVRVAPTFTWEGGVTLTNQGKIQSALYDGGDLTAEEQPFVPMGWTFGFVRR